MKLNRFAAPAAALALVAIASASAGAQTNTQTDARWRAWTGCWSPVRTQPEIGSTGTVCVVPTEKASAVEIVTVVGGGITDRTRVDADGVARNVSRDGCTGTEMARWSTTGTRVQISETLACAGGATRKSTSIMSFDQTYQWLDVRGVTNGNSSGVAVARFQMVTDTTGLPADVRSAVALRGAAANSALLAASAPLTLADIADVSTSSDSGVAATWLMERTRGLQLTVDGKQLAALADQGVPPSVIDVIVAIAHPRVFALAGASAPQMREPQRTASGSGSSNYWRSYPTYYGIYDSPFYDPWYGFYGGYYSPYAYRYGYYSPYGGYGYGAYSGYYPGPQPIVVVNRPDPEVARPHGRVTRSGGYSCGSSCSSGGSAERSSGSSSSSTSSSSSSGGSSTTSGSSTPATSGSTTSSSGGDRVAVRKPPL